MLGIKHILMPFDDVLQMTHPEGTFIISVVESMQVQIEFSPSFFVALVFTWIFSVLFTDLAPISLMS